MVCQYPTPGLVSSEKHEMMLGTAVEGRSGDISGIRTALVKWAATILGLCGSRSVADWLVHQISEIDVALEMVFL